MNIEFRSWIMAIYIAHRNMNVENGNLERGRAVSFLGISVANFRYSVFAVSGWLKKENIHFGIHLGLLFDTLPHSASLKRSNALHPQVHCTVYSTYMSPSTVCEGTQPPRNPSPDTLIYTGNKVFHCLDLTV
jgi:hypothetical protein